MKVKNKSTVILLLLIAIVLTAMMLIGLTGCQSSEKAQTGTEGATTPEKVTITTLNGNKEQTQIEVPYSPERIAILDLASLDIIDSIGMGDRVVGMADTSIDYLSSYSDNKNIANLGTIKEADIEAVMACEPDIIFIGGRLLASYDALSEIAPVVYLATDTEIGLVESVTKNATTIASIFGLEDEIVDKTKAFSNRISALQAISKDKTALVGMTTSGSFNLLGNDGRCSIIGVEIQFDNLTASAQTGSSAHGNESSFEVVVAENPDYIFVMDRDAAIGTNGAQLAKEIVENELVKTTTAYKEGHIVYLANPNVWYTAEGGIKALDRVCQVNCVREQANELEYVDESQKSDAEESANSSSGSTGGKPVRNPEREKPKWEDTITNRMLHWSYTPEQKEEVKKALAAGVPKATILTYFYPEVTVEKMSSYRNKH